MEHDIGSKIKSARLEKKLTQEHVAELLGVSRQTISNWENEKSYPDIISVIKMSDCYEVSLDYLLKGEQTMKTYYEYLEESTNVVKSNTNRNKIIIKGKWALTLFFGVMYMLAEYGTFAMANNIAFDKLNTPEWGLVVAGVIISAIGMLMGSLLKKKRCK